MRERLVVVLVGLTVAFIALYGVPRAYVLADLVERQELRKVERTADITAHLVDVLQSNDVEITSDVLDGVLHEDEGVVVEPADGSTPVRAGRRGAQEGDVVVARDLPDGGTVTLFRSGELIEDRISSAILPLVAIGLGLVLAAVVAGVLVARWLARPFQDLARAAQRLGTGRFELDLRQQPVREADQVATALTESGRRLERLLAHEREIAVHASHELRTPLAALRLELEDLATWPQTDPEVAEELTRAVGQLDRLAQSVSRLLEQSRESRRDAETEVDVVSIIRDEVSRTAPSMSVEGTTLRGLWDVPSLRLLVASITAAADGQSTIAVTTVGDQLRIAVSTRIAAGPALERVREHAGGLDGVVVLEPDAADGFTVLLPLRSGALHGSGPVTT